MDVDSSKPNIILLRYQFFTRNQGKHETIDEYVAELRLLSKDCEFDDLEEELVKDRVVCGVRSARVRGRLLRVEDLDLESAVRLCHAYEELRRAEQAVLARDRTGRRTSSGHGDQPQVTKVTDDATATTKDKSEATDASNATEVLKTTDPSKGTETTKVSATSKAVDTTESIDSDVEYRNKVTEAVPEDKRGGRQWFPSFRKAKSESFVNKTNEGRYRSAHKSNQIDQSSRMPFSSVLCSAIELDKNGIRGQPFIALYTYENANNDELNYQLGDVFVKLRDTHDPEWSVGRKDGRVGVYRNNQVRTMLVPGKDTKALYDYTGLAKGHLSFKKGDIVEALHDYTDMPGWGLGLTGGRAGLYPLNYVKLVS